MIEMVGFCSLNSSGVANAVFGSMKALLQHLKVISLYLERGAIISLSSHAV